MRFLVRTLFIFLIIFSPVINEYVVDASEDSVDGLVIEGRSGHMAVLNVLFCIGGVWAGIDMVRASHNRAWFK